MIVLDRKARWPRRCAVVECTRVADRVKLLCRTHWRKLPEDLQIRLRTSVEDEDDLEVEAALNQVFRELE